MLAISKCVEDWLAAGVEKYQPVFALAKSWKVNDKIPILGASTFFACCGNALVVKLKLCI